MSETRRRIPNPGESFADKYPIKALDWDYEVNIGLTPDMFTPMSGTRVGWKCPDHGHKWNLRISDKARYLGGCPYCFGSAVLIGFNDLATVRPDLLELWDYELNDILPTEMTYGSNAKVWWKCLEHGHNWNTTVKQLSHGRRCNICSGHNLLSGFNDMATKHPEVLEIWDWEANGELSPYTTMPSSRTTVAWKCEKYGHTWSSLPHEIVIGNKGCPTCSGHRALRGFNDLESLFPEISKEWDLELNNNTKPFEYTAFSQFRADWKCVQGHAWSCSIGNRTGLKSGCPRCSKRISKIEERLYELLNLDYTVNFVPNKSLKSAWRKQKYASVDIYAEFNDNKFVIEYDGSYWHKDKAEIDIAKTEGLLKNEYIVIRIRENDLFNLDINHKNYFELSHPVKGDLTQIARNINYIIKTF